MSASFPGQIPPPAIPRRRHHLQLALPALDVLLDVAHAAPRVESHIVAERELLAVLLAGLQRLETVLGERVLV